MCYNIIGDYMDYAKRYKKLSKKYHMKRKSKSYAIVYLALIYLIVIVNIGITLFNNKIEFMNIPYIISISLLSIVSLISFFKDKSNKKELLYIILTIIIGLCVIPFLINNLILVAIILGLIVAIYIIKTPIAKTNKVYSSNKEPVVLSYSDKTEFFRRGTMIYKKNSTGEDWICNASAFDNGDIIIMKGNNRVSEIKK